MSEEYKKLIELAFSKISVAELKAKLTELENVLPKLPEEEVYDELKKILVVDINGIELSCFKGESRTYKKGGIFYRARDLDPKTEALKLTDFWEPPQDKIKYGRLNQPKQQLLYISPGEIMTPMKEAGIKENNFGLMVRYEAIEPINVMGIGFSDDLLGNFPEDTNNKINLITNFLKTMFLQNNSLSYLISSVIAQKIYDFDNFDGWVYPSVANQNGHNLCLKLPAKSKLKIHSAFIFELINGEPRPYYSILVDEKVYLYNDWKEKNSKAQQILDDMFSDNGQLQENEVLSEISYQINFLR
ncbi:hypothetical protein H5154_21845 [Pseudoalteromonas sp. SR44-5]|uniref:hypothetical protein n=1 Tax=Pseudoalteromonas sp. SR44-5 TaxID=2760934 RepID=UPI0015FF3BD3|nr:hypothetical protein [Pseudoalteromonas sp. SR44-5]MBB1368986.1 hypothetical protein [Pseudoalteromonas sp. SR44-5]